MSESSIMPAVGLQPALKAALERALRAEKAFVSLKLESYIKNMHSRTSAAEQEFATKKALYGNFPDQLRRLEEDFQRKTRDINMQIDAAKEIHKLFMDALNKGLTMDDLPLSSTDSNEVRAVIQKLLADKEVKRKEAAAFANNNMRNTAVSGNGEMPTYVTRPPPWPNTNGVHTTRSDNLSTNRFNGTGDIHSQFRFPTNGAPFSTVPPPIAPPFSSATTTVQNSRPHPTTQYQYATMQPAASFAMPYDHNGFSNKMVNRPQMSNGVVGQDLNRVNGAQQLVMNDLGSTFRQQTSDERPKVSTSLADSNITASSASNMDSESALSSSVTDLDNFVIEDDMFSTPVSKANSHNATTQNPSNTVDKAVIDEKPDKTTTVAKAGPVAVNGGEVSKDNAIDSDADSIDDDEQFAKNMASLQGTKPSTTAATKPKVVKEATGSAVASKNALTASNDASAASKNASTDEEVDWSEEPWLTIHQQLVAKYKINKNSATQALQSSVRKLGGITKLDAVWAEAEKIVQNLLKPNPLQATSKASKPPVTSSQPVVSKPAAQPTTTLSKNANTSETGRFSNFKTRMCNNWLKDRKCPQGNYCTFAHGEGDLRQVPQAVSAQTPHSFFKVILCRNYETNGTCNWGDHCIFAHGESELRNTNSQEAKAEGGDPSIPHPEPCNNQQCPWKLDFLLRKTGLCEKNKHGLCTFGKECKFAHSRKELKPLPKYEMCQRHMVGKCHRQVCVYAHSKSELRKKPAELSNTKPVGQASGGRPIPKGTKYVPWAGQDKHPATPKDGEECLICMGPLLANEKKSLLACGHNSFHERCISQWVNEGMPSCPVCRKPAKLPDLFKAPAGFQPEEFPGLGL